MNLPDLTGYLKEDAAGILEKNGIKYSFTLTTSPRDDVGGEEYRVVRQSESEEGVLLTLCRY